MGKYSSLNVEESYSDDETSESHLVVEDVDLEGGSASSSAVAASCSSLELTSVTRTSLTECLRRFPFARGSASGPQPRPGTSAENEPWQGTYVTKGTSTSREAL